MAILELVKPGAVSDNDWYDFTKDTYGSNINGGQRIDKNGPNDRRVKWWDDTTGALPDESTVLADYANWKALPGNSDKDRKIDQAKDYATTYFHEEFNRTIGPAVKAALGPNPTNAEIAAAIRTEIDGYLVKTFALP